MARPRLPRLVLPAMPRLRGMAVLWPLVAVLVALAGLWELLIGDIDAFEERTGFFDRVGTLIIDAVVGLVGLLAALYAASVFFPRLWGEKAGIGGALVAALVAAFCFRVLWLGGA